MNPIISLIMTCLISSLQIHAIQPKCSSFNKHEFIHNHEKSHKQEMLNQLKNVAQQYIEHHKLAENPKLSVLIQNNLALINNEEQQEAIAIFEIPKEISRQGLSEKEINRLKELFEVYESCNYGKYKVIKFRYRDKNTLPENKEQATILLYAPNLMEEDQEDKEVRRPRKEIFDVLNEEQLEALHSNRHIVCSNFENIKKTLMRNTARQKLKQEGVAASTTIKTDKEKRIKIENLKVGDMIASRDKDTGQETYHKVTYIDRTTLSRYIEINFVDETLQVAHDHKFYITSLKHWITASELKENVTFRLLLNPAIREIKEINRPLDVIRITVDSTHNFYIADHKLLAHNFNPTLIITVGQTVWEMADKIAYTILSGTLSVWAWKKNKANHPDLHSNQHLHQQNSSHITNGLITNGFSTYNSGSIAAATLPSVYLNNPQQDSQQKTSAVVLQEPSKENNPTNKQSDTQKKSESGGSQQPSKDPDDNKNKEDVNKTVESIIRNAKSGKETSERTKQYEKSGGYEDGVKDFEKLNPSNIRDMKGKVGKVGDLKDGRIVNVRIKSKEGRPTLEIFDPNTKNSIKIRYGIK